MFDSKTRELQEQIDYLRREVEYLNEKLDKRQVMSCFITGRGIYDIPVETAFRVILNHLGVEFEKVTEDFKLVTTPSSKVPKS
jgi:hypothetical protein